MLSITTRPLFFKDVIGQDLAVKTLKMIAKSDKISTRSIVMQGGYGCGKTTLARIFARAVNCPEFKKTGEVCNTCEDCLAILEGRSEFYQEHDAARVGNVDSIKSLTEQLTFKVAENKTRVITLDETHACLDYRTPIELYDNSTIEAKQLVESDRKYYVKSVNLKTSKVEKREVVSKFNNGIDRDTPWFVVKWDGACARVTANHKFYINGEKVEVSSLVSGVKLDSVKPWFSPEAKQVLIGTCLGDSSVSVKSPGRKGTLRHFSQSNLHPTVIVQMMQGKKQHDYLEWKADFFRPFVRKIGDTREIERYTLKIPHYLHSLILKCKTEVVKNITELLPEMGPLAWLCWYLDDGYLSPSRHIEISCTNIGEEGALSVKEYCKRVFGWDLRVYVKEEKRFKTTKPYVKLRFTREDSDKFFQYVSGLIDIPCINYKVPEEYRGKTLYEASEERLVPVSEEVFISSYEDYYGHSHRKESEKIRYNLEVEGNHNYTLPGGLLTSNCSTQAMTAILKVIEEGIPNTVFVFCTTEALMKTVMSRSCLITINTVPEKIMKEHVLKIAESKGITLTELQAEAIVVKSEGHVRNAMQVLDHFSIVGEEAIKTPYELISKIILKLLKKEDFSDLIIELSLYRTSDIAPTVALFLKNCFLGRGAFETKVRDTGIAKTLFNHFYTPQVRQALNDEYGVTLAFQSLRQ